MKFEPGHKGGPGRPKGSINKENILVRAHLEAHGFNLIDEILNRLPDLDTKDQVDALVKLLPFAYPKLNAHTIEAKTPEEVVLSQLSLQDLEKRAREILEIPHGTERTDDREPIDITPVSLEREGS